MLVALLLVAPAELVGGLAGQVAELLAFDEVDDRLALVEVDGDDGVGGVQGVLERPGWLLGDAHLGVGSQPSSSAMSSATVIRLWSRAQGVPPWVWGCGVTIRWRRVSARRCRRGRRRGAGIPATGSTRRPAGRGRRGRP